MKKAMKRSARRRAIPMPPKVWRVVKREEMMGRQSEMIEKVPARIAGSKFAIQTLFAIAVAILLAGCMSNPSTSSEKTLVIGPERMTCQGFIEKECLVARNEATGKWEFFYEEIEGFTHVPGFIYTLEVRLTDRGAEIQDVGRYAYALVRVVDRERVSEAFRYDF